jgi:long-chain acyl-CoA synthetase
MTDTIPKLFKEYAEKNPELAVQLVKGADGNFRTITYAQLYRRVEQFACGLHEIGVRRGDHVGIVSDNLSDWLVADLAILCLGGADVPRGSDSTPDEITYILDHAGCALTLVENETQLEKVLSIKKFLPKLKTVVVISDGYAPGSAAGKAGLKILTFQELLDAGSAFQAGHGDFLSAEIAKSATGDLATIIYTSGTTGEPKGVMLSHANYMHQIRVPHAAIEILRGDIFFSVLPVWHSYERAIEYVAIFAGCSIAYSKPLPSAIIEDMGKVRPMIFPSVPRIWEGIRRAIYKKMDAEGGIKKALFYFFVAVGSLHSQLKIMFRGLKPQFRKRSRLLDMLVSFLPLLLLTPFNLLGQLLVFKKIKQRLGGRFRYGVSGAGALPPHVDAFFSAAGVLLLEGYGLTETAPIVSVRPQHHPVPGTIGPPLPEIEIKVTDELGLELPPGQKGVLSIKGPNVMMGYYKKPDVTAQTLSEDGWLNTGDLAILTVKNEIKILGRVKETIVLLGGENVEPGPIEDTMAESEFIDQSMVVGQDQKFLAALVVPSMESLAHYARENGISYNSNEDLLENADIQYLIMEEINNLVSHKRGFKLFERINKIQLLAKPFQPGVEMTHTLKLKRDVITELYKREIAALFAERR